MLFGPFSGPRNRDWYIVKRSRGSRPSFPASGLSPNFHHVVPWIERTRPHFGEHKFERRNGFLSHVPHLASLKCTRLLLRMARTNLKSSVPRTYLGANSTAKGLVHVLAATDWFVQILGAILAKCWTRKARPSAVQGNAKGPPCVATRLSRVLVRLSLWLLRCYSPELHPNAKLDSVSVSKKYEITGSIYAQFKGKVKFRKHYGWN